MLVQKVKYSAAKVYAFIIKQYFAENLQVISFKKEVHFLHRQS